MPKPTTPRNRGTQSPSSTRKSTTSSRKRSKSPAAKKSTARRATQGTSDAEMNRDVKMFYSLAAVSTVIIFFYFSFAPTPEKPCPSFMEMLPGQGDKAEVLGKLFECGKSYKENHHGFMIGGYMIIYITAQTFAIPGPPLFLTILAGSFYTFFEALMLIGFCATTGSSLCFLLSKIYGKGLLKKLVDEKKLDDFRSELGKQTDLFDIVQFMLLTRVTPVPNVLVNLASPWMDVPLWVFSLTTFVGQIPLNSMHVTTGKLVAQFGGEGASKADDSMKWYIFAAGTLATLAAYVNWKSKQSKQTKSK